MNEDIELKKYCIDKAFSSLAGPNPMALVREMYNFLLPATPAHDCTAKPTNSSVLIRDQYGPIRKWNPAPLTKTQKAILQIAINIFNSGDILNGVSLAGKAKCTQSNASSHLKNLTRKKYLRRINGRQWSPAYDQSGRALPVVVTECPPRAAKGYKGPLTAKISEHGRK